MRLGRRIEELFGGRREPSPLKVWRALSRLCEAVLVKTDHGHFWCDPCDQVIGRSIFLTGQFDYDEFSTMIDLVSDRIPKGAIFLDVGANIGTHTIYALKSGCFERAICFEPEAGNFRLLQMNIEANGFSDRCDARNVALGSAPGTVHMAISADNHGDHRISSAGPVTVPVTTLDDALEGIDLAKCFLHMDVQGYEAEVLRGAGKLLNATRLIYTEFWPDAMEANGTACVFMELAQRFGTAVDMKTLRPVTLDVAFDQYRHGVGTNILLEK